MLIVKYFIHVILTIFGMYIAFLGIVSSACHVYAANFITGFLFFIVFIAGVYLTSVSYERLSLIVFLIDHDKDNDSGDHTSTSIQTD